MSKPAMDDASKWLAEIRSDVINAGEMLGTGFDRGDWSQVSKAGVILRHVANRLANLEQLAQSENWRMLADRNGWQEKKE